MKLSLSWIFDYIGADWRNIDVPKLMENFYYKVAEVEGFKKFTFDLKSLVLARVEKVNADEITLTDVNAKKVYKLQTRENVHVGGHYLLKQDAQKIRWAAMADFGSEKESLLPEVFCTKEMYASWRSLLISEDYVMEIGNTAISHRPDLWCHRGIAREIAALLELPFKDLEDFLANKIIKNIDSESQSTVDNPFALKIENSTACPRFAGLYFDFIESRPSVLPIMQRLCIVDSKPIDAIVDLTNYVMLDISQPMHAYDAKKLESRSIVVRSARAKESVKLLDDQDISLEVNDLVVVDGKKPVALAGIMGGLSTAISKDTESIFLESACFDAGTVRKTSKRLGIRTDASVRFEKSLDPNQNVLGIRRFLKLLDEYAISSRSSDIINSLGSRASDRELIVTHEFIEQYLGIAIAPEFVRSTLERLAFRVEHDAYASQLTYKIFVPTFRGTKDVTRKEDIVEEVGRYFGYDSLPCTYPTRAMAPFSIQPVMRLREIKETVAYGLQMREVYNYALCDEAWLSEINWQPSHSVELANPLSENARRLVTTLVPGLLQAVDINKADSQSLRFFEWGRTWRMNAEIHESKSLAGIMYEHKQAIDFYDAKGLLLELFDMLSLPVTWAKVDTPEYPWYAPYQTAYIMHNGTKIGIAGKINCAFFSHIAEGDAFIFDLDGDYLMNYQAETKTFNELSKYPGITRDVSVMIQAHNTSEELIDMIRAINPLIVDVKLVDYFAKEDWHDKRSLTFRCLIQDEQKTLTTEQADAIMQAVGKAFEKRGAIIR